MLKQLLLVPLLMEWVLLVTISLPLALARRSFCDRNPRLALSLWFAGFLSAGLAAALALGISAWVAVSSWMTLNEKSMGSLGWLETFAISFLPWIFLALGGIGLTLLNQKLEPIAEVAREISTHLARALTEVRRFEKYSVVVLEAPVLIAMVAQSSGSSRIVVSRGLLEQLDAAQLDAVLWHEVGHIRGRHNMLRRIAGFAATVAPFISASLVFQAEVDRLCEIEADRFAAHRASPAALAAARQIFRF